MNADKTRMLIRVYPCSSAAEVSSRFSAKGALRYRSFLEQIELDGTGSSGILLIGLGACFNQAESVKTENGREVASLLLFVRIPRYRTGYFQPGDAIAVENGYAAART